MKALYMQGGEEGDVKQLQCRQCTETDCTLYCNLISICSWRPFINQWLSPGFPVFLFAEASILSRMARIEQLQTYKYHSLPLLVNGISSDYQTKSKSHKRVILDALNEKLYATVPISQTQNNTMLFLFHLAFPQKTLKALGSKVIVNRWSPTLCQDSLLCP